MERRNYLISIIGEEIDILANLSFSVQQAKELLLENKVEEIDNILKDINELNLKLSKVEKERDVLTKDLMKDLGVRTFRSLVSALKDKDSELLDLFEKLKEKTEELKENSQVFMELLKKRMEYNDFLFRLIKNIQSPASPKTYSPKEQKR